MRSDTDPSSAAPPTAVVPPGAMPPAAPVAGRMLYRVPYADTDQMGVVYYANYLTYFERCRNELLRAAGRTYREFEAEGLGLPVVEAHVDYRAPARYDDLLELVGTVASAQGCRVRIDCAVLLDGRILARGYTVHCCLDLRTRKPVRVPAELALHAAPAR